MAITLIMQTNNLASNVILSPGRLTFDTMKAFAPISLVAGNPHVLVVHPSIPAKDLKEFLALTKTKPGGISYASGGTGTVSHFAGELMKMVAGVDMVHVPYQGSGLLMPNLLGGQVDALFAAIPTVTQHIRAGTLRAIAVTTTKRFHNLPNVPTIAESGYPATTSAHGSACWRRPARRARSSIA
jgi:tripartite-type tricarboxylate transporter receptor subunit TctC